MDLVGVSQQHLPGLGQGDSSTATVKQGNPVVFLQGFHMLGHRRLGNSQRRGRPGEMEFFRDGSEDMEAIIDHGGEKCSPDDTDLADG